MFNLSKPLKKQSGVVLVISLVMLLLLTLIGVTGAQVTSLEEKMAGSSRDQNIAFQAAEATLLQAEAFIAGNEVSATTYSGANGLLDIGDAEPADYFLAVNWQGASSKVVVANTFALAATPRYIIKRFSQNAGNSFFRVTARAVGKALGTQIILQSIYVRPN